VVPAETYSSIVGQNAFTWVRLTATLEGPGDGDMAHMLSPFDNLIVASW
jgi:hypothetical protein